MDVGEKDQVLQMLRETLPVICQQVVQAKADMNSSVEALTDRFSDIGAFFSEHLTEGKNTGLLNSAGQLDGFSGEVRGTLDELWRHLSAAGELEEETEKKILALHDDVSTMTSASRKVEDIAGVSILKTFGHRALLALRQELPE